MEKSSSILPKEFFEFNPRLWSFILLLVLGIAALLLFPVKPFDGYIDPFYSPTVLILPIIGLFRLTCYAFREDYNRHVFKHPLSCPAITSMDGKSRNYTGETSLFMKVENLHRYFMYVALLILPFFYYDLFISLTYFGGFTLRLGSLLMGLDVVLLTLYVFSCHSIRSFIGGREDCYSCLKMGAQRKKVYDGQSWLNTHHRQLAWASLISVIAVDLFIRAVSAGWPIDLLLLHLR